MQKRLPMFIARLEVEPAAASKQAPELACHGHGWWRMSDALSDRFFVGGKGGMGWEADVRRLSPSVEAMLLKCSCTAASASLASIEKSV